MHAHVVPSNTEQTYITRHTNDNDITPYETHTYVGYRCSKSGCKRVVVNGVNNYGPGVTYCWQHLSIMATDSVIIPTVNVTNDVIVHGIRYKNSVFYTEHKSVPYALWKSANTERMSRYIEANPDSAKLQQQKSSIMVGWKGNCNINKFGTMNKNNESGFCDIRSQNEDPIYIKGDVVSHCYMDLKHCNIEHPTSTQNCVAHMTTPRQTNASLSSSFSFVNTIVLNVTHSTDTSDSYVSLTASPVLSQPSTEFVNDDVSVQHNDIFSMMVPNLSDDKNNAPINLIFMNENDNNYVTNLNSNSFHPSGNHVLCLAVANIDIHHNMPLLYNLPQINDEQRNDVKKYYKQTYLRQFETRVKNPKASMLKRAATTTKNSIKKRNNVLILVG